MVYWPVPPYGEPTRLSQCPKRYSISNTTDNLQPVTQSRQYIALAHVTYSASLFIIAQHTERYSEKTLQDSCLKDKVGQNLSTLVSTQVNAATTWDKHVPCSSHKLLKLRHNEVSVFTRALPKWINLQVHQLPQQTHPIMTPKLTEITRCYKFCQTFYVQLEFMVTRKTSWKLVIRRTWPSLGSSAKRGIRRKRLVLNK